MNNKKFGPPPIAQNKMAEMGIDAICDKLCEGETLTAIAKEIGVAVSGLVNWIEKDQERSARAREARTMSARLWDEKAEAVLTESKDQFELAKARELASHYRWRAKAIAPRDYGDKVQQEHVGQDGGPITVASVNLRGLTDEELENMHKLISKAVD